MSDSGQSTALGEPLSNIPRPTSRKPFYGLLLVYVRSYISSLKSAVELYQNDELKWCVPVIPTHVSLSIDSVILCSTG